MFASKAWAHPNGAPDLSLCSACKYLTKLSQSLVMDKRSGLFDAVVRYEEKNVLEPSLMFASKAWAKSSGAQL